MRTCNICQNKLPLESFYTKKNPGDSKGVKSGHYCTCKKCLSNIAKTEKYKDNRNKIRKEYRHKTGISKVFLGKKTTEQEKKERKRISRKTWRHNFRAAGKVTTKVIQLVYEDNIKKYGTLTCYLCLKPIEMQKEHLEHKTPLSRGGTNDYENLGIACGHCNCSKHNKTVEEYLNKKEK